MPPVLHVNRSELARALTFFKKARTTLLRRRAVISFEDDSLVADLGGYTARAKATGSWPGRAEVSPGFFAGLALGLPKGDPISIEIQEDGRLHCGTLAIPCTWHPDPGTKIIVPVNADLADYLRISLRYSPREVAASGLTDQVKQAEKERDALIARAAKTLDPLGISPLHLRQLVDELVTRSDRRLA